MADSEVQGLVATVTTKLAILNRSCLLSVMHGQVHGQVLLMPNGCRCNALRHVVQLTAQVAKFVAMEWHTIAEGSNDLSASRNCHICMQAPEQTNHHLTNIS